MLENRKQARKIESYDIFRNFLISMKQEKNQKDWKYLDLEPWIKNETDKSDNVWKYVVIIKQKKKCV